ncbi:MAG: hypothetical protein ACT443_03685 [Gemmatimonadota bacterium]
MKRALIAPIAFIALIAIAHNAPAQARLWQPDERVTITSFGEILALTYDGQRVYAATPNGLEIYDALAQRWLLPSTVEDGYPVFERPVRLQYDRSQAGLWLVAASGNAYLWSDLSGRWDLRAPGDVPRPASRASADADVAFNILRRTLSLDPSGRRYTITAIAAADRPGTYWVGTDGGNMLRADARSLSVDWLTFGTLSRGVGALALDEQGGIWFGGDGYGMRNGITRADAQLQSWTSYEPYVTRAPRGAVTRLLAGDTIWSASAEGVHVLAPGARVWRNVGAREGLASEQVGSLERTSSGVWAGTRSGLALIDPAALRVAWRGLDGVRINGIATRGDTVWIASERGLWLARADASGVRMAPAPGAEDARFRTAITSVARVGDRIAVLAAGRVYLYDSGWSDPLLLQSAQRAYTLRGDAESLYLLYRDGIEEWNAANQTSAHLSAPYDFPAAPRDVVRSGDHLWVATPAGALRLNWP